MFYKLKVKDGAKKAPAEMLGFPVKPEVSTYVETTRDLVAEATKKNIKTVSVEAVETIPERGEDGNAPHVIHVGDHVPTESEASDEQ
jgi:hypothetical protein